MRIIVSGSINGKFQALPSRAGWLHRITFFRFRKKFREVFDVQDGEWVQTLEIPGPVDVTISAEIVPLADPLDGIAYMITASLHPDGLQAAVIWADTVSGNAH